MKKSPGGLLIFVKVFFFLISPALIITGVYPLSLQETTSLTLQHNPQIKAYKADWQAASAKIPQNFALDDPEIALEYEQIPKSSGNLDDGMKIYKLEQMIAFPGKLWANYLVAGSEAKMAQARYVAGKLEILTQVKMAYYDLFFISRSLEINREIGELIARMKKIVEAKYTAGSSTQAEILQTSVEYLLVNNENLTLQQEKEVKKEKLRSVMGINEIISLEVDPVLFFSATFETGPQLLETALENRPEIVEAKARMETGEHAQLRSKMDYFPDTTLGYKDRVTAGSWDAMFSFSVPLYFWKQGYGVAAAGFDSEKAKAEYENMVNMTRQELNEIILEAKTAHRTVSLYKEKILPQSYQALQVAFSSYQAGKIDLQTVLQIAKTYKEVKINFYATQITLGKAWSRLDRIMGRE